VLNKRVNVCLLDEDFESFRQVICDKSPFSRVLLVALKSDFKEKGQIIFEQIKKTSNKIISVIFEDDFVFSIESVCGLFNAPEDVRLIISISDKLSNLASYFAQIKNIPLVVISSGWKDCLFDNKLFIKNGGKRDYFLCDVERFIYLNKFFLNDIDAYSFLCAEKFKLLDIFITCEFTSLSCDKLLFERYYKSLNCFEEILFNKNSDKNKKEIFINLIGEGYNFYLSLSMQVLVALQVVNCFKQVDNLNKLFMAEHMINFVYKGLKNGASKAIDYNVKTEEVSKITSICQQEVMENFLKQIKKVKTEKDKEIFIDLISKGKDFVSKAIEKVKELGARKVVLNANDVKLLEVCGDTPLGMNFLSVFREII